MNELFSFACPRCSSELEWIAGDELRCPSEGLRFPCIDGIWRFILPDRQLHFQRFIQEYEAVRRAEGRGSTDPAYYRALPFTDRSGVRVADWRIRARTYKAFVARVLRPLETSAHEPLKIVDTGAGNGWLSYRLAQRGHQVAAVDLLINPQDGLGAHVHYDASFTPIQSEYDRLPFSPDQFDLLVFNASFHYTTDPLATLQNALHVLRSGGRLAILDTPFYLDSDSGTQMVKEREAEFKRRYGFPSNSLPSINFLTFTQLEALGQQLGIEWKTSAPFYGLRWALRPLKARLLGRREPAKFLICTGKKP